MIHTVLFDLGNVLVHFRPDRFWDAVKVQDEEENKRLKAGVMNLGRRYESGVLGTEEFQRELHTLLKDFDSGVVDEAFLGVLPGPIEGMEALVQDAAKKCGTGLVSNTNPLHFRHCLQIGPALKHIQRFYLSYDLKTLKPSPEFYAEVIRREGVRAEEIIFIDDIQENVDGAIRAGMKGIRFTDPGELRAELATLGL